jgi:hypothetical protein
MTLLVAQMIWRRLIGWLMNDELEGMWKELILA